MTIQEIRNLIAKKIEGQGSAIDIGNGLPAILNAICDHLVEVENAVPKILVSTKPFESDWSEDFGTPAEAASFLGITEEEFAHLEDYVGIQFTNAKFYVTSVRGTGNYVDIVYGGLYGNMSGPETVGMEIMKSLGSYTISSFES